MAVSKRGMIVIQYTSEQPEHPEHLEHPEHPFPRVFPFFIVQNQFGATRPKEICMDTFLLSVFRSGKNSRGALLLESWLNFDKVPGCGCSCSCFRLKDERHGCSQRPLLTTRSVGALIITPHCDDLTAAEKKSVKEEAVWG